VFGLWEPTLRTLALTLAAVLLSVLVGVPLGVFAARSHRTERVLQPILDTMQTMPPFVYLIPVILIFGIGRVPSVIATMIYAIPPVIRLTALGLKHVSPAAREAADAFGSTARQRLFKVELPLALPMILAGVNQTIMMALGMVVISAMIGTPGLGREVFLALPRLRVGQAFEAGLAIVLIAVVLDRISGALEHVDLTRVTRRRLASAFGVIGLAAAAGFAIGLLAFPVNDFPAMWRLPLRDAVEAVVQWLKLNVYAVSTALGDAMTLYVLNPLRNLLQAAPWPVVLLLAAALAQRVGGWRLAIGVAACAVAIGLLGMWSSTMDTLSQVLVTLLITALIALPLGVLASQSRVVSALLRPINDVLQTLPTFVFLVPVMMLFNLGRVPGLIAAVLYAIPVGIKLTELGVRRVSPDVVEAARAFGSTRFQTIAKVQLPLARASIAAAVNQMTMLVLAMTCISGMVGGTGLGQDVMTGFARNQTGLGIESGLAIVLLAIALDRVMQKIGA
jgi:glycine betaine/proline transport system permease protein